MITTLQELYTTRLWNLRYEAVTGLRDSVLHHIHERIPFEASDKVNAYISTRSHDFNDKLVVTSHPDWGMEDGTIEEGDQFITVLNATGVLTRNGDMCTYGSRDHRDLMLWAAKQPNCIGHLFMIDGPGGSSWCKNDYIQAIDAVHAANQPVVALVDGICASAHQCLAALCDECYYVNPKNEFGCIGTLAAFFTNKDGDIDAVSQERYVEVYATGSPNKNIEFRKAAEGNNELIQKEVDEDAEEFKAIVREHRPNVTEEILSGKVFTAKEVEGILNDGQGTMESCINRIVELHEEMTKPAADPMVAGIEKEDNNNPQNQNQMKEYQNIMEASGLEALVSDKENGIYLVENVCDTLEGALATYKQKEATLEAKLQEIAALNESIKTLKAEHQQALEKLNNEHQAAIDALNSDHQSAIDTLNNEHQSALEAKGNEINGLNQQIEQLNGTIAERDTTIAEQAQQIQQLSEETQPAPTPTAQVENEGTPAANPLAVKNVCTEDMTPEERRQALEARLKSLR